MGQPENPEVPLRPGYRHSAGAHAENGRRGGRKLETRRSCGGPCTRGENQTVPKAKGSGISCHPPGWVMGRAEKKFVD